MKKPRKSVLLWTIDASLAAGAVWARLDFNLFEWENFREVIGVRVLSSGRNLVEVADVEKRGAELAAMEVRL